MFKDIQCFILDMDGTLYLGNKLIDGALDFIKKVTSSNRLYFFLTNNSSKNSRDYQKKLAKLGIESSIEQTINSGQVTADYIKKLQADATVYLVGTNSLHQEFQKANLKIATERTQKIDFIVLGFDTTLNYQKLWDAHDLILKGVPYLATNPDYVCPLENGKTMPDCGSMISLLKASTGREPLIIGKPNPLMVDYVLKKSGIPKGKTALIGDRLYTDIQTGINAGITSILVLSGETRECDLKNCQEKPDYVFPDLKEIARLL